MPVITDRQQFKVDDFILKVRADCDRSKWDEDRYEAFLDLLCDEREYQKEAIRVALRYLLGSEYANLRELAQENWEKNSNLQDKHGTWTNFERHLQLPDKLSASLDLATGTGKSYVIYGIATILLAEGAVDRVLVLCPSTTIEFGLYGKFKLLAGSSDLEASLPEDAKLRIPKIIQATETITPGCICVENRDAVYAHVKSSIKDSLWGKGARVAVLNDEEIAAQMHHALAKLDMETSVLPKDEQTRYAIDFPYERLLKAVKKSLGAQKFCTEANKQKMLQGLGTLRRKRTKVVRYAGI